LCFWIIWYYCHCLNEIPFKSMSRWLSISPIDYDNNIYIYYDILILIIFIYCTIYFVGLFPFYRITHSVLHPHGILSFFFAVFSGLIESTVYILFNNRSEFKSLVLFYFILHTNVLYTVNYIVESLSHPEIIYYHNSVIYPV